MSLGRNIFVVYSCPQPAFIDVMFFFSVPPGTEFGVGHVSGKKKKKSIKHTALSILQARGWESIKKQSCKQ